MTDSASPYARQSLRARVRWAGSLLLGGWMTAAITHCDQSDYPIDPTFCDDWCRMLLRVGCDQEPENCVRVCERSRPSPQCIERERTLLVCYEATPASEFVCTGQGFSTIPRPNEEVCQLERDALIECEYPEVKQCLDICRLVESIYAADAAAGDAGDPPERICPSRDIPCDSICWIAGRFYTELPESDARDDVSISDASTGRDLEELLEDLVECSLGKAERCRSGEVGDAGDAGDAGLEDATWATVLRDCAEELGF